jgi:hypothetical protein
LHTGLQGGGTGAEGELGNVELEGIGVDFSPNMFERMQSEACSSLLGRGTKDNKEKKKKRKKRVSQARFMAGSNPSPKAKCPKTSNRIIFEMAI